jgi:hypothetical protein
MRKFIVITSIFEPTEAIIAFSRQTGYELVVVGDKKTPVDWHCENTTYLSVDQQKSLGFKLPRHLPYNHYCRKMIGYLYAMANHADIIIDTDDDNIPLPDWSFPKFVGTFPSIPGDLGFVNIYELYTSQKIWPRGLPLRHIHKTHSIPVREIRDRKTKVGVWQGLANEDPDVDAIYRLTSNRPCMFKKNGAFVLNKGTITPFNTQNTAFSKDLFVLLYLPSSVTFRFTDILRGFIAQPIMWKHGYHLGFTHATVTQKRNPHDYMKDFASEIPMYLHSEKIIDLLSMSVSATRTMSDNLHVAYSLLCQEGIVSKTEMKCLDAWLTDCTKLLPNF